MDNMTAWEMAEALKEALGADRFLRELISAMSTDALRDYCKHVARIWDIALEK